MQISGKYGEERKSGLTQTLEFAHENTKTGITTLAPTIGNQWRQIKTKRTQIELLEMKYTVRNTVDSTDIKSDIAEDKGQ